MDKYTRVFGALDGKKVDRPPVSFWFHFFDELGKGKACIDAHVQYYKQSNIDFIKVMSDGYFQYPVPDHIKNTGSWRELQVLDREHPYITEQLERARGIRNQVGDDCPIFYNVFAPFSSIRFGTSNELVMRHLEEDPDSVLYALDIIARSNALLAELLITEGGCDGIYYCLQGGENNRFSIPQYRNWITPSDKYVLDHANRFSDYNLIHLCGWAGIKNNLEVWRDYPAKAVNWAVFIEGLSLSEGKQFFEGKAVIGGFDNRQDTLLYSGTNAELRNYTHELISGFDQNGLLIGADCSLSPNIDQKQIAQVVAAAAAWAE